MLEYAIYHSPVTFFRELLEIGADPNHEDAAGFPSLIAAISSGRTDKSEIVELLISVGADLQQRGVNDHTPLHDAVSCQDQQMIILLLSYGADLHAGTRIDDYATPPEEAEILGHSDMVEFLHSDGSCNP